MLKRLQQKTPIWKIPNPLKRLQKLKQIGFWWETMHFAKTNRKVGNSVKCIVNIKCSWTWKTLCMDDLILLFNWFLELHEKIFLFACNIALMFYEGEKSNEKYEGWRKLHSRMIPKMHFFSYCFPFNSLCQYLNTCSILWMQFWLHSSKTR